MSNHFCSVSVVIPCYKSSAFLKRAVESVVYQTQKPNEIILVDDASDDGGLTTNCIRKIQKDYVDSNVCIKTVFLRKNSGPSAARNCGWNISKNDYVAFLDSDDAWHPKKLELQYNWMKFNDSFDVTSHSSKKYYEINEPVARDFYAQLLVPRDMFFKNVIQTRTVMLKRKLTHRFDEKMRYGEDFDLWMRMMAEGVTFGISKQQLAFIFREEFSEGGLSSNLLNMEKSELKVLYRHYRSGELSFFLLFFICLWSIFKFISRSLRRLY